MAARVGVPHLVLTHLIPRPEPPADVQSFAGDPREGSCEGSTTVGHDHDDQLLTLAATALALDVPFWAEIR